MVKRTAIVMLAALILLALPVSGCAGNRAYNLGFDEGYLVGEINGKHDAASIEAGGKAKYGHEPLNVPSIYSMEKALRDKCEGDPNEIYGQYRSGYIDGYYEGYAKEFPGWALWEEDTYTATVGDEEEAGEVETQDGRERSWELGDYIGVSRWMTKDADPTKVIAFNSSDHTFQFYYFAPRDFVDKGTYKIDEEAETLTTRVTSTEAWGGGPAQRPDDVPLEQVWHFRINEDEEKTGPINLYMIDADGDLYMNSRWWDRYPENKE